MLWPAPFVGGYKHEPQAAEQSLKYVSDAALS